MIAFMLYVSFRFFDADLPHFLTLYFLCYILQFCIFTPCNFHCAAFSCRTFSVARMLHVKLCYFNSLFSFLVYCYDSRTNNL